METSKWIQLHVGERDQCPANVLLKLSPKGLGRHIASDREMVRRVHSSRRDEHRIDLAAIGIRQENFSDTAPTAGCLLDGGRGACGGAILYQIGQAHWPQRKVNESLAEVRHFTLHLTASW